MMDPNKNTGLGWSHVWSPGRPGPGTGTVPGGLTCGKFLQSPVCERSVNLLVYSHTDTHIYLLSLALALLIHNKQYI